MQKSVANAVARRAIWKVEGRCTQCGAQDRKEGVKLCAVCHEYRKKYQRVKEVTPETRAKRRAKAQRIKQLVMTHYGNRCVCCPEANIAFLELDHINNDGASQRKMVGSGSATYEAIIRNGFPTDLQILCSNCNRGKWRNGGVCPHQEAREKWQSISSAPQIIDSTLQKLLESNLREQSTYLHYASSVA